MKGAFLGPSFDNSQVEKDLKESGAIFKKLKDSVLIDEIAAALTKGKAIGWMHGRMEFGPRALGARSIIADPRSSIMQKQLNLKVKYRESFRPFAPSILVEDIEEWFGEKIESPYMSFVLMLKKDKLIKEKKDGTFITGFQQLQTKRSIVPSVTHIDYSARVQTVSRETNPHYHLLLTAFKERTGVPMLVNTSFNVRGEPIVCSPKDAFRCFMNTELDILVIENYLMIKHEQNAKNYKLTEKKYVLD